MESPFKDRFHAKRLYDYNPIKGLLEESVLAVFDQEGEMVNSAKVLSHIRKAEKDGKVAVFHNIKLDMINLSNEEFYVPIIFSSCDFSGSCKFTANSFFYPIFFHSVTFARHVKFKLSVFFNGAGFINCVFNDSVSFERSKFLASNLKYQKKEASGLEVLFPSCFQGRNTVDFLGSIFTGDVSFVNANFGCSILFSYYKHSSTIFHKECDFSCNVGETDSLLLKAIDDNKYANKELSISLDKFHRLTFLGVKFHGEVTFENRIFQKKTIFKETIFDRAPKFHNAELHQDTDFHGAEFRDTYSEGAERAYRSLKLMMDKKRARREEGMFFALEQKSMLNTPLRSYSSRFVNNIRMVINNFIIRCISATKDDLGYNSSRFNIKGADDNHPGFYVSLTEKLVSFSYLAISDYGQSIKRPVLILVILLLTIFPALYMLTCSNTELMSQGWGWGAAIHLSMQQLFRPFEIYAARYGTQYTYVPFSLYLIATMQSMLNVGLITLFILAIRGKFRMY